MVPLFVKLVLQLTMIVQCFSLTALLSFMLADEMTTGSVTSSDADKRAYAARSHAWNVQQKRFKDAFPEVCHPLHSIGIDSHCVVVLWIIARPAKHGAKGAGNYVENNTLPCT